MPHCRRPIRTQRHQCSGLGPDPRFDVIPLVSKISLSASLLQAPLLCALLDSFKSVRYLEHRNPTTEYKGDNSHSHLTHPDSARHVADSRLLFPPMFLPTQVNFFGPSFSYFFAASNRAGCSRLSPCHSPRCW